MAPEPPSYDYLSSRLDSFTQGRIVNGLTAKGAISKKTIRVTWPHGSDFKATPDTLARAGFYYAPVAQAHDQVQCFLCTTSLDGWEEDDDPFEEHSTRAAKTNCPWALACCAIAQDRTVKGKKTSWDFNEPSRFPTSTTMEKNRLRTFKTEDRDWPHDAVRGHSCSSKALAKAGFVYTPDVDDDDQVTCFYCMRTISAFDEGDDPIAEHRRKEGAKCPFLRLYDAERQDQPSSEVEDPPPARRMTRTVSTSIAKPPAARRPTKGSRPSKAPSIDLSSSTSKTRRTKATNGSKTNEPMGSESELGVLDEDVEEAPPSKPAKSTSKGKTKKHPPEPPSAAETEDDSSTPAPQRNGNSNASSSRQALASSTMAPPPPRTVKQTRSVSAASIVSSKAPTKAQLAQSTLDSEPSSSRGATSTKRTRSRSIARPRSRQAVEDEDSDDVMNIRTQSKVKKKPPTRLPSPSEDDEAPPPSHRSTKQSSKSAVVNGTSTTRGRAAQADPSDEEEPAVLSKSKSKSKALSKSHSRTLSSQSVTVASISASKKSKALPKASKTTSKQVMVSDDDVESEPSTHINRHDAVESDATELQENTDPHSRSPSPEPIVKPSRLKPQAKRAPETAKAPSKGKNLTNEGTKKKSKTTKTKATTGSVAMDVDSSATSASEREEITDDNIDDPTTRHSANATPQPLRPPAVRSVKSPTIPRQTALSPSHSQSVAAPSLNASKRLPSSLIQSPRHPGRVISPLRKSKNRVVSSQSQPTSSPFPTTSFEPTTQTSLRLVTSKKATQDSPSLPTLSPFIKEAPLPGFSFSEGQNFMMPDEPVIRPQSVTPRKTSKQQSTDPHSKVNGTNHSIDQLAEDAMLSLTLADFTEQEAMLIHDEMRREGSRLIEAFREETARERRRIAEEWVVE